MKVSLSAVLLGAVYFVSRFVVRAHELPNLPNDPLSLAIRKINAAHSHHQHEDFNLTALYSEVIPPHLNYTEAVNQALKGEVGCGCGNCPCLCSYGCKGKNLVEPCCNEEAGNDENCNACSGYPDGVCIGCKSGYTLQGGTTCKADPGCMHQKHGECIQCRPNKTLVDQLCTLNPQCAHQKHGICTRCAKGKHLILSDGLCAKKTGQPGFQIDDEDEIPLLEGEQVIPRDKNATASSRLNP